MTSPLGTRIAAARRATPRGYGYGYIFAPVAVRSQIRRNRRTFARGTCVLDAQLHRAGLRPLRVTKGNRKPHIPLRSCIDGHVYRIDSRNLSYGVFHAAVEGFTGIRNKFGWNYLFTEFHWDQGPPYGTVTPLEDLGPLPALITDNLQLENQPLFAYLDNTFYGGRRGKENAEQALAAARERAVEEAEEAAAKAAEGPTPC